VAATVTDSNELVRIVLRQLRADETALSFCSLNWQVGLITDVLVDGQNRHHAWQQDCDTEDEPNKARPALRPVARRCRRAISTRQVLAPRRRLLPQEASRKPARCNNLQSKFNSGGPDLMAANI
jgi:hypothetical protein